MFLERNTKHYTYILLRSRTKYVIAGPKDKLRTDASFKALEALHWEDWCWSWSSNTLPIWCEELTHWKRPRCWERLRAGGEGGDRGWDGWMASLTRWTWVWVEDKEAWSAAVCGVLKSWRRRWHPTPVLLPGKSHGRRSLEGYSPWGCWGSDTTKRLHFHFSLSCIGEGNGNPLQCSCLENPRDGGAWWAAVYGVPQSRTRLKQLSSSTSSKLCTTYILFWTVKYLLAFT